MRFISLDDVKSVEVFSQDSVDVIAKVYRDMETGYVDIKISIGPRHVVIHHLDDDGSDFTSRLMVASDLILAARIFGNLL